MFLEHLKRQILKRCYTQGLSFARSTKHNGLLNFKKNCKRGFALIWFKKNVPTVRYGVHFNPDHCLFCLWVYLIS
jgi:hypothetical protein